MLTCLPRRRHAALAVGAAAAAALTAVALTGPARAATSHRLPTIDHYTPAKVTYLSGPDAGPPPAAGPTSRRFTPAGIQNSYNLPQLYAQGDDGAGKTIAIVDSFGYPQAAADLKQFSQDYGLPMMCGMPDVPCTSGMPTFKTLTFGNHQVKAPPANHSPGQENSNAWSVEVALDIEYAHTTAPGANILLVATPTAETLGVQGFPNMMNAEQYVVDHHLADVVTQSFGAAEGSFGSAKALQNLRHAFISGTAQGITFMASSGDNGSVGFTKQPVGKGGAQLSTPQVGWPASDPLVTAIGGTNLCTNPNPPYAVDSVDGPSDCQMSPGQRETGWNGSGGGYSNVFAKPSWQTGTGGSTRAVPDISMDASCGTYVVVLDTAPGYNGYYGVCGTSAASPMFAGIVAIADQVAGKDLGLINDDIYALQNAGSGIYDVTSGNNTQQGSGVPGYAAGPGWDAVTGVGSPADADAFVHALAPAASASEG